jgi:hypothetical protein
MTKRPITIRRSFEISSIKKVILLKGLSEEVTLRRYFSIDPGLLQEDA